jgi:predicted GNAT family acetyltransferase
MTGMSTESQDVSVRDNPDEGRYEAFVDGQLAGFSSYHPVGERLVFTHTEVDPAAEGKGVGSALARYALDDVRRQGRHLTPICQFITAYIRRHPEYVDLVDEQHRGQFRTE